MKKFQFLFVFMLSLIVSTAKINAQAAPKTINTVAVLTSSTCDECKMIIEAALKKVKGVKKSNLNLETHIVTVTYANRKTDEDKIRLAISKAGYDADDIKADQEAYDNLPKCCKKAGME
jgi:periplasmic mercuric ion binding protein